MAVIVIDDLMEAADRLHRHLAGDVAKLVAMDPKRGSRDGVRLRSLAKAVEAYEKARYPGLRKKRK